MAGNDEESEAVASDAASLEQLRRELDERERRADERAPRQSSFNAKWGATRFLSGRGPRPSRSLVIDALNAEELVVICLAAPAELVAQRIAGREPDMGSGPW